MTQNSYIHKALITVFVSVSVIAVAAFASGYAGQVSLNIGPNGITFGLGPGPSPAVTD